MSPQSKTATKKATTRKRVTKAAKATATTKSAPNGSKFRDAGKELGDAAKKIESSFGLAVGGLKEEGSALCSWITSGKGTKAVDKAIGGIVKSFKNHRTTKVS